MSEHELIEVIERVVGQKLEFSPLTYLLGAVVTFLASCFGGYFSSYFKKTGEISAISKSLSETNKQLSEQARAVEEVKSELSKEVWIEQQKWEFKRDLYLPIMKLLIEIVKKCELAETHLDQVRKIDTEDCDEWEERKDALVNKAERIYQEEVGPLSDELELLILQKGRLFFDEEVLSLLDTYFKAEELRRKGAWESFRNDLEAGVAIYDDQGSYDSYEHSLYHKNVAAKAAYEKILQTAKVDLAIKS